MLSILLVAYSSYYFIFRERDIKYVLVDGTYDLLLSLKYSIRIKIFWNFTTIYILLLGRQENGWALPNDLKVFFHLYVTTIKVKFLLVPFSPKLKWSMKPFYALTVVQWLRKKAKLGTFVKRVCLLFIMTPLSLFKLLQDAIRPDMQCL